MTIGIFAQGGHDWVGGAELTKNLVVASLLAADAAGKEVRFVLLGRDGLARSLTADWTDDLRIRDAEWPPPAGGSGGRSGQSPARRTGRLRRWFGDPGLADNSVPSAEDAEAAALEALGIDFLYPARRWPSAYHAHSAAWIFDMQHRMMPEMFSDEDRERREKNFQRLAAEAATIVFSSETARAQFGGFYPDCVAETSVLPFRVVIPDAWKESNPRETAARYHLPENYYLVCNQFWKHKNHRAVIDAVAERAAAGEDCHFVFTGRIIDRRDASFTDEILSRVHQAGVHERIRILGLVPKADQIQLVRGAKAVVQPSFFEGWNTLVEEAHALGVPILLSDLPVHREQSPPHVRYFDPGDSSSLVEAMRDFEATSTISGGENGCGYGRLVLDFGRRFLEIAEAKRRR